MPEMTPIAKCLLCGASLFFAALILIGPLMKMSARDAQNEEDAGRGRRS